MNRPLTDVERVVLTTAQDEDFDLTYLERCALAGDIDLHGDLIEPGRFKVFGWTSPDTDAPVEDFYAATPAEAGEVMAQLLREGYYQIGVFDARSPNRPSDY